MTCSASKLISASMNNRWAASGVFEELADERVAAAGDERIMAEQGEHASKPACPAYRMRLMTDCM